MKHLLKLAVVLIIISITSSVKAQTYTVLNAHSHNDYKQAVPFFHAYKAGFGAIEADVFNRNGKLLVAHDEKELQPGLTLKKMYIDPILDALIKDTTRRLTLLVDVKEDYWTILPELIKELKPLRKFCRGEKSDGRLFILISGNRPPPNEFKKYPDFIFFDEDLLHIYDTDELKKIGQVSLRYTHYSKWKGIGEIPSTDEARLKHVIDSVHAIGKPIRFWDAPDNAAGWTSLIKLHADVIGTDKIDELSAFLRNR